jgi:CDP-glucose 4,6-dehydratase
MVSISQSKKVSIRNPYATRPWQHVLEPLSGYLAIGQKLLEEKVEFGEAWNFGPSDDGSMTVEEVVQNIKKYWNKIDYEITRDPNQPHEANLLKLDCSKAHILLKWKNVWDNEMTFAKTVLWYKNFYEDQSIDTMNDLNQYIADAKKKNLEWSTLCK